MTTATCSVSNKLFSLKLHTKLLFFGYDKFHMKHTLFLLTLLISSYASGAAPHEDLATLLNALNFDSTMTLARTYLAQDAQDASACSFIGEVYFECGRYDSAFYYLQKTLDLDKEKHSYHAGRTPSSAGTTL
jgi:tetratricopeptide (TPR) repeat protein